MSNTALPYHEPGIVVILILASFLILLNLVGCILDKLIYCGLLGQLFIGVAWGAPGGQWLNVATQEVFVQLGYLGLILLVFEGGLSTNFQALKANLYLSICVALTGISLPIGISFMLTGLVDATPLQAFAAGAALCSTSLGTTFTVLKTSGLRHGRLGVVLTSAAMLDDVVGLVMVQIISNLGTADSSVDAATVIRPIGVSVAFAVAVPLLCHFVVKLLAGKIPFVHGSLPRGFASKSQMAFLVHTATLVAFVVASSYAGTSNLFAAYLAGASISWYSEAVSAPKEHYTQGPSYAVNQAAHAPVALDEAEPERAKNEEEVQASQAIGNDRIVHRPVTPEEPQMLPSPAASEKGDHLEHKTAVEGLSNESQHRKENISGPPTAVSLQSSPECGKQAQVISIWEVYYETPVSTVLKPLFFASIGFSIPISQMFTGPVLWRGIVYATLMALGKLLCGLWLLRVSSNSTPGTGSNPQSTGRRLPRPKSLYPASILGCAMVARGEIGFLIAAVAESRGIFASAGADGSSELFLIVTWAIMFCTIAGPIAVGLLTRRVRRLQEGDRSGSEGREDPLGIWGVT